MPDNKDNEQIRAVRRTKENSKRAQRALDIIKANPDLNWFYFGKLKEDIETADMAIHRSLSKRGGDLTELQRLQAEINIREELMNDPKDCIEAEKNMKKELRKQKKEE